MPVPHHQRTDSFGEFVSADDSDVPMQDPPQEEGHNVLDLRDVEKRLDAKRTQQIAEAMAAEPAVATAPEPVTLVEEPELLEQPSSSPHTRRHMTSAPSSSHWAGSLWHRLSSMSGTTDSKERPPHKHRRPSVVRHRTSTLPITGAPGFDPQSSQHWNHGHWSLNAQAEREREKHPIPVSLQGRREDTDTVIESWHAARLQAQLPRRLRLGKSWSLVYSLDQHGASLATLYSKVGSALDPQKRRTAPSEAWLRGASTVAQSAVLGTQTSTGTLEGGLDPSDAGIVLAIRDTNDHVFGAFINEPLHVSSHYYGNGECFLWKTVQRRLPMPPSASDGDASEHDDLHPDLAIEVFRWTGKNDYVVLSESDYLSVGGGDGRYGLWVDEKLDKGLSAKCPAFHNEVLCHGQESSASQAVNDETTPQMDLLVDVLDKQPPSAETGKFRILGVEVWAVGLD
ncbi:oxidation resistance protein 1 [Malassezia nana]|uniref:Oxidation resistance protein 1 n=1 Tax=Malassezia nana TaxID=180528 RepID=A0AAF0EKE2_9BASI|nr:oxidation resistance protein 1 [Malassezia nana]